MVSRLSYCIYDLSGFFLMYSSSCCGEDLSILDPLHRVNMIWQLLHKYYLLFLMQSNLLWCCDLFFYDVTVIYSISAILMLNAICFRVGYTPLHYELRCFINNFVALAILWQMYDVICSFVNESIVLDRIVMLSPHWIPISSVLTVENTVPTALPWRSRVRLCLLCGCCWER